MKHGKALLAAGLLLGLNTFTAQASLFGRGGGLIYDDILNVTWLQDANYAKTSGYDTDGLMTWDQAQAWADNLVYGGYSDWRLPFITDSGAPGCDYANSGTDCGFNVNTGTSELAYMYHVNLGLKSLYTSTGNQRPDAGIFGNGTTSYGQSDVGLVNNLQNYAYWSGSAYAPTPDYAWFFDTAGGIQDYFGKYHTLSAWAVRSGESATVSATVPVPCVAWLFGSGILTFLGLRSRTLPKFSDEQSL